MTSVHTRVWLPVGIINDMLTYLTLHDVLVICRSWNGW